MQLQRFIDSLKADLNAVAELGDETTADAAGRLVVTLQASVGLRLLDALSELALELNEKLPSGHVEVRLSGQDPELVYVGEEPDQQVAGPEAAYSARITLRLPEALKVSIEAAASREGVSVNSWIVRALARSGTSGGQTVQSGNRLTGYARS
ncbi:MAG TPA: toxin-antitoxin system HicB family antitoxin [Gaiellaceae bacterium]|nr:toxin-antitoxin system HicB family antitoxin [Gaiellaceae bacterium]